MRRTVQRKRYPVLLPTDCSITSPSAAPFFRVRTVDSRSTHGTAPGTSVLLPTAQYVPAAGTGSCAPSDCSLAR